MLLRSEGKGRGVLSRNAYESSLTVKHHKDEMQPAHWSDLSKWKQSPFVLLSHTMHQSLRRLTSLAFNVHFEHAVVYSVLCYVLCCECVLMCPRE